MFAVFYSEKMIGAIFIKMAQELAFGSTKKSPRSDFKILVRDTAILLQFYNKK